MGDTFSGICADQGVIQQLFFLIGHIRDQQGKENVEPLDLGCQLRSFDAGTIQHFFHGLIDLADLQHVDTAFGGGGDTDKLTACIDTGAVKLMAFQRCQHENLYALAPHTERHQQDQEGLSRAAGAAHGNVGVLIDLGIEDVDDDRRVVVFVQTEQNTILITQLIGCKRVAACHAGGQGITLGAFIEMFIQRYQRQGGHKRLFLTESAAAHVHVAGHEQLFHFIDLPFQFVHRRGCYCDQQVQVVEILVVAQAFFQKVAASDGAVQIVKVRIGVAGILDFAAVDTKLLAQSLYHAGLWLAADEHIQINAITGVDDERQPTGRYLRLIAGGWYQQIGIV